MKTGKLCPAGWHAQGDAEWITLELATGLSEDDALNLFRSVNKDNSVERNISGNYRAPLHKMY
jgi:hypothetical protein